MADEKKHMMIIIDDRFVLSAGRDVVSFALLIGAVGLGVMIGSSALQWIAGLLWVLWLLAHAGGSAKANQMTIAEARKKLDEIEAASR